MTKAVIGGFYFEAIAATKEDLTDRMDRFALDMIQSVGGAPWKLVQDDINLAEATTPIRDHEGQCYVGARKYIFGGPLVANPYLTYNEGHCAQGSGD